MKIWNYIWIALLLAAPACRTDLVPASFQSHACSDVLAAAGARCGTITVPENHDAPDGRNVSLNVLILPALEPDGVRDAEFDLEGGPGFAATDLYEFYLTDGQAYRRHRDIVFVDMRGTGKSGPLRCRGIEAHEASDVWSELYPEDLVRACRTELARNTDLNQYTTENAARDLEMVRETLGYESVSLVAMSYGTQLALTYMALFPDHVDRAVLFGAMSADAAPPATHAPTAEAALMDLLAACRAQQDCAAAYPDPLADLSRAQEMIGPEAGRRQVFAEWLRTRMYSPVTARQIPLWLKQAAGGDFSAMEAGAEGPQRVFADGLYLSITCAESFPRMDFDAASLASRGTLFGDYRLRRQRPACDIWNVAPRPLLMPDASTIPVLIVSGAFDPVTPPEWAESLLPRFAKARNLVLAGGGHDIGGMSGLDTCLDPVLLAFTNGGDLDTIDFSCVETMTPPEFDVR